MTRRQALTAVAAVAFDAAMFALGWHILGRWEEAHWSAWVLLVGSGLSAVLTVAGPVAVLAITAWVAWRRRGRDRALARLAAGGVIPGPGDPHDDSILFPLYGCTSGLGARDAEELRRLARLTEKTPEESEMTDEMSPPDTSWMGYVHRPEPKGHECNLPAEWPPGAIWRCWTGEHLWQCVPDPRSNAPGWWAWAPATWRQRRKHGGKKADLSMAGRNRSDAHSRMWGRVTGRTVSGTVDNTDPIDLPDPRLVVPPGDAD